eukprot:TRINITY_DN22110_c0_g1_i1.p1 TRINITY_DN22110_c0_g1~~TRINITY_DN22110_c0_g1_i1.p1  ORF type:complete len:441 (+),score=40.79 TRINITY_DN22110_c0_g1_i1:63-1385(+)
MSVTTQQRAYDGVVLDSSLPPMRRRCERRRSLVTACAVAAKTVTFLGVGVAAGDDRRLSTLLGPRQARDEAALSCPTRECLPEDVSRGREGLSDAQDLCFTNIGNREAFAECPAGTYCTRCATTPPCESFCEAPPPRRAALGDACHLDRECEGLAPLAACVKGACRVALWAGQTCGLNASRPDTCLYGAERCVDGVCEGLGTNSPCWPGYPDGLDLDCRIGWYCLRMVCVPQLPNKHSCHGEHPNECIRGHRCNLFGDRPQCTPEYSLQNGVRSSDERLCITSHIDPRGNVCAQVPPYDSDGGECRSDSDCSRNDGSFGRCACKRWWSGEGEPGFCEHSVPDRERPFFLQFWDRRNRACHHDWSEERCATEMGELELLTLVLRERQATADPTLPVPACAQSLLDVVAGSKSLAQRRFHLTFRLRCPVMLAALLLVWRGTF